MKKIKIFMGMLAMFALLLTSCSQEDQSSPVDDSDTQAVELKFGTLLNDLANRAMSVNKDHFNQVPDCADAAPAVVSIDFSYGGNDYETDVEILSDGTTYFTDYSEDLIIAVPNNGSVTVTLNGFRVYDGDPDDGGNLIWVAPVASTPGQFDGYVSNALPFDFEVRDGTKPYIDVEVLCFDRRMVNEYGYPFFDLVPGKLYPLCFFANYCTESGRHYVGNYSIDLYYDNGEERISLYTSSQTPETGYNGTEYYADPLCLVVPESPFEDMDVDYLFYVVTPLDWTDNYGDIDNTPVTEVGLSWNDIDGYLNADGETVDYIHLLFGCNDVPGGGDDCIENGGDADGDGICDNDDDCINGVGDCPDTGDDCIENGGDADGDGICDNDDDCINGVGEGCDNNEEDDCDETAYVGSSSDNNAIQFNELSDGPNRWGFIYDFMATGDVTTKTLDIYAGASNQYNLNSSTDIGDVEIMYNQVTNEITVTFDFENSNNDFGTLHVNISETIPGRQTLQAPGRYNMNRDVEVNDGDSFTFNWEGDDSFYIVIHGEGACIDI